MPPAVDEARIAAAIDVLARHDLAAALLLSSVCEPRWRQRIRRYATRDELVQRLAAFYPAGSYRAPTQAMARDLARAAASRAAAPAPGTREAALADVLAADAGRPLSARQIANILRGERTPIRIGK